VRSVIGSMDECVWETSSEEIMVKSSEFLYLLSSIHSPDQDLPCQWVSNPIELHISVCSGPCPTSTSSSSSSGILLLLLFNINLKIIRNSSNPIDYSFILLCVAD
jgi:hypothetical protein